MAGKVTINIEKCKGCGLCVAACPKDCIGISSYSNKIGYFPARANNENCTGCAMCAVVCPDAVIKVFRGEIKSIEPNKKKSELARKKL